MGSCGETFDVGFLRCGKSVIKEVQSRDRPFESYSNKNVCVNISLLNVCIYVCIWTGVHGAYRGIYIQLSTCSYDNEDILLYTISLVSPGSIIELVECDARPPVAAM